MDRPFYGVGQGDKKSGNPDQPDEKFCFKIFKTLSWSQFLTNIDEILTYYSPYRGVEKLLTAFPRICPDPENPFPCFSACYVLL